MLQKGLILIQAFLSSVSNFSKTENMFLIIKFLLIVGKFKSIIFLFKFKKSILEKSCAKMNFYYKVHSTFL